MSYAAAADLEKRLGNSVFSEIYDPLNMLNPGGTCPEADADLESAQAEIDGALAAHYRLPVTAGGVLSLLKDWCLTLAEERAYARAAGSGWAEKVKTRVEQVRKYLEMVRSGSFKLAGVPENTGGAAAFARTAAPVFGRDKMRGF